MSYTKDFITRNNFDWLWSKPTQKKKKKNKKKKLLNIKKKKDGIVYNVNDIIRVSSLGPIPEPRSIYRAYSLKDKKTLAELIGESVFDTNIKVPQMDEAGNILKTIDGKIIYKKQKLKDVITQPTSSLLKLQSFYKKHNNSMFKVANALISMTLEDDKGSIDTADLQKKLKEQYGITEEDFEVMNQSIAAHNKFYSTAIKNSFGNIDMKNTDIYTAFKGVDTDDDE